MVISYQKLTFSFKISKIYIYKLMYSYKKCKFTDNYCNLFLCNMSLGTSSLKGEPLQPNIHIDITRSFLKLLAWNLVCRSAIAGSIFLFFKQSPKIAKTGSKWPKTDPVWPRMSVFGFFWPLLATFWLCVGNINVTYGNGRPACNSSIAK